jgi:hypothetical protein
MSVLDARAQLLRDARRLNVACSRAKHKLILVGSAATLARGSAPMARVIDLARSRGWLRALPTAADLCYPRSLLRLPSAAATLADDASGCHPDGAPRLASDAQEGHRDGERRVGSSGGGATPDDGSCMLVDGHAPLLPRPPPPPQRSFPLRHAAYIGE